MPVDLQKSIFNNLQHNAPFSQAQFQRAPCNKYLISDVHRSQFNYHITGTSIFHQKLVYLNIRKIILLLYRPKKFSLSATNYVSWLRVKMLLIYHLFTCGCRQKNALNSRSLQTSLQAPTSLKYNSRLETGLAQHESLYGESIKKLFSTFICLIGNGFIQLEFWSSEYLTTAGEKVKWRSSFQKMQRKG